MRTASLVPSILVVAVTACAPPAAAPMAVIPLPQSEPVLRVQGDQVVNGLGQPVLLRGIAFGNRVWQDDPLPDEHHSEIDYDRVRDMGMNAVRFYMNYLTFMDADAEPGEYREEGFRWLDDNVAWAKQRGIYLILNLHVPPGGYQSLGRGRDLWESPAAQERFVELWKAIAERYRGEPTIAGYDFLNEPVVTQAPEQWIDLANRTVKAVRAVDPEHIFFIERFNAVQGDWKENDDRNFFLVDDPNVVYEFHFYKPFHFTHQGAPWVDFVAVDQRYPDQSKVGLEWYLADFAAATFGSPALPPGDSDWTYYEGEPFQVKDPDHVVGKPSLVCKKNHGKAYFDDLVLEQLDTEGNVVGKLYEVNLTDTRGWYFWSEDASGHRSGERVGHGDEASVSIAGTTADANLSAEVWRFRAKLGETYRLSGWMKGEAVQDGATCQIRLDFYSAQVPVHARDRDFLAQELDAYVAWGKEHGVPLFLGEFGAIRAAFEDDRGGDRWTSDMLDLLFERNLHFTYHDYHEDSFGLYLGDGALPSPDAANEALITVFTRQLGPTLPARPSPASPPDEQ